MKTRTKLLALVMTLAMLVSVFAAFPVNAATSGTAAFEVNGTKYNTLKAALEATTDGQTVKMLRDYTSTAREEITTFGNNVVVDGSKGDGTCWKLYHNVTNNSAFKLYAAKKITFQHIDVITSTRRAIMQTHDSYATTLVLGEGLTFTEAQTCTNTGNYVQGAIMAAGGSTIILDGAVFDLNGASIVSWNKSANVVLNSGTLSYGNTDGTNAAITNNGSYGTNVTFNSTDVKVNDYVAGKTGVNARQVYVTDLKVPGTLKYGSGLTVDDFFDASLLDMTKPFYVTPGNSASGIAGTYDTLAGAVAVVKDTGTIKMINNYTGSENVSDGGPASWTLDGDNKIWTATSGDYCLRLGKANQTVTLTKVTFDYKGVKNRVLQVSEKANAHLILGTGVTIKNTGSTTVEMGIMQQCSTSVTTKVTLSGASFEINAPAIKPWGNEGAIEVVLNSGKLSTNGNGAIQKGYNAAAAANITLNSKAVQVNDYSKSPMETRSLYLSDFKCTYTPTYGSGLGSSDFMDSYITINNGATKYYSLAEAVAAAQDNDTLTVKGQMFVSSAAVIVGKTLTLQGADANASITATGEYAVMVLHNSTVTVQTLKLVGTCQNTKDLNQGGFPGGVVSLGDNTSGQVAYTGAHLILNSGAVIDFTATNNGANTGGNGVSALVEGDSKLTVNTGAIIKTGGTAIRADGFTMKVTIAGGTITSSNRGMVVSGGSTRSVLTMTSGTFSVTGGGWLLKTYTTSFRANLEGGTLSAATGKVFDEAGAAAIDNCVTLGDVTIKANNVVVYDASYKVAFDNKDMMYLYVDAEKTNLGSGLGFASHVTVNTNANVKYGVLIAIDGDLDTELDFSCDMNNYNGKQVLNVAVDDVNAAGFVKGAVVGLSANMMKNAFVGRAYATITITIGDLVQTKTVYGQQMSATARDFARAYVEANTEIDTETQAVVDYFLANGNA